MNSIYFLYLFVNSFIYDMFISSLMLCSNSDVLETNVLKTQFDRLPRGAAEFTQYNRVGLYM